MSISSLASIAQQQHHLSHSRSMSLQIRRRPTTRSLYLLFDTQPVKSPATSPLRDFDSTVRDRTIRRRPNLRPPSSGATADPPLLEIAVEGPSTPTSDEGDMQFGAQFPPTPTPSIHSSSQRGSLYQSQTSGEALVSEQQKTMFANAEAGPSSGLPQSLPPTPPVHDGEEPSEFPPSALAFAEPTITQRPRRGRRPASVYPAPTSEHVYQPHRKNTDPTPRNFHVENSDASQQLDVDLDAYSTTDFDADESREPTLSFVTTSTADSTTGTPASIGAQFVFKGENGQSKPEGGEPRIRLRSTTGRANAYSSAESSMASGAYSYHAYADNHIYHPHPPPMPNLPSSFVPPLDHVGLGITAHDLVIPNRQRDSQVASSPSTGAPVSPSNSFAHRPWKRDVMNRLRSDSASSSITTASASTSETHASATGVSSSSHAYPFAGYAQNLPWEREEESGSSTPEAVALVDEGNESIFDKTRLEEMGGLEALDDEAIASLRGTTHLLLANVGSEILSQLSTLLTTLAPSLVVLDISENYLSLIPDTLRYCTCLEELNISGNPIRALPAWLGELVSLRMLIVDECAVQSLPSELAALTRLHTLCARRNRLVALPSWLCLLNQLETLRVDDNPFASEWVSIVAPILASPPRTSSLVHVPPRSTSQRALLRTQASVASFSSTRSSIQSISAPHSAQPHEAYISPSTSATQSLYQLSGLGPIAEDHPHSAPLGLSKPTMQPLAPPDDSSPRPSPPERGIRKMRSAGQLLNRTREQSSGISPIMSAFGVKSQKDSSTDVPSHSTLIPPSSSRFASLGARDGRRAASVMGNYESDHELSPPAAPRNNNMSASTSTKTGKWGFLRKMSMNRLKGDKSDKVEKTALAASASANLKSLPPPLLHTVSEMGPVPVRRPSMTMSRSAMTLPTRRVLGGEVEEFGQAKLPLSASTLPIASPLSGLPSAGSMFGGIGGFAAKRGKRKSFLPVDGPPLINIAIPSTSPFMPTTTIFDDGQPAGLRPSESDTSIEDASMTVSASRPLFQSPTSEVDPEGRYASGLESIKSYLRDLFDLSRPPIEPYGGFEVMPSTDGSCGASSAPSDHLASPASANLRGSISDARRARRPTLETQTSRATSTASGAEGESSSFAGAPELTEGKKFKNDKAKRARVIREIYETERTYVRGLGELVTIYVRPASQSVGGNKNESVVPAAERKVVFGGIESIMSIHRDNLLPSLEKAIKPLLEGVDDEEGQLSTRTAHAVGEVFRTYIAYMKQYSTYINNFDNALSRMKTWTAPTSAPGTPGFTPRSSAGTPNISSAAISVGVGLGAVSLPAGDPVPHSGSQMSTSQRKRVKTFLKRCREHPMHSQINLESYLLLPIQRVPRYKLLLEDLAMCTMPQSDGPRDTLDDALNEIASLASLMNEEKRDADSRLRLYHWQQRISSRGPSPLVQPHRKLIMDGALTLIRLVKKASTYVEVDSTVVQDGEQTIMPSKVVVPVEHIAPEPMDRPMMLVLCTDLMVLVQQRAGQDTWEGQVDLFNVLRMATLREPASIVNGVVLRVVDNKSIYYFNGQSPSNTLQWCRAINSARRR